MTRQLALALAGSAALILAGSATAASAADPGFCRDYARAAVRQTRAAQSHDRCTRHTEDGSRWSSDFGAHYNWCLSVHREDADAERDARTRTLERCAH